eukprot:m.168787 g.168787  ORF g.168787 m.168787 type:complete len:490 (+) comp31537_c1_seq3:85-1554(+)
MFKKKSKEVIDPITKNAPWYMPDAQSEEVKAKLTGAPDGTFAIRASASVPGNYVLAYAKGGGVKLSHITGEPGKVQLKKATRTFACMIDLIKNYSESDTAELPVKLIGADFTEPPPPEPQAKSPKAAAAPKPKKGKTESGMRGSQWKIQDVCDWLESIELKEYTTMFKKQKIDGAALLVLNDNDLRTLGVGAFGARKKLTQCIATLNKKFEDMDKGNPPPPGLGGPPPVSTVGLIARKVDGEVKIFDIETGQQVFDIAQHQADRAARDSAGGGVRPPPPQASQGRTFADNEHEAEQWFDKSLPKAKAVELLQPLSDGEFAVYSSGSNPGCFSFSYVHSHQVQHKLIEPCDAGLKIKGVTQGFPNLCTLVDFYTKNTGGVLKCSLVYPRSARNNLIAELPQWNCLDLDKAQALAKIQGKGAGAFVIRPSDKSYAALSLLKPDGSLYNQHIEETSKGLQLKKSTVGHADLNAFVAYYKNPSQTDLPCALVT